MKQTYRVLAGLIALGVVVQASAIALGGFTAIHDIDNGAVFDENSDPNAGQLLHGIAGMYVIPLVALILVIVSFFTREVPQARKWAGIVFGLVVLQVVLAFVSFGAPIVGALHGINALVLLGTAGRTFMLARDADPVRASRRGPADIPSQTTDSSSPRSSRTV